MQWSLPEYGDPVMVVLGDVPLLRTEGGEQEQQAEVEHLHRDTFTFVVSTTGLISDLVIADSPLSTSSNIVITGY